MKKYTFKSDKKRQYHREGRMSKAEVMMIMILFHSSGYRCLKHFYLESIHVELAPARLINLMFRGIIA